MNESLVVMGLLGLTCILLAVQVRRQSRTILRYRIAEIRAEEAIEWDIGCSPPGVAEATDAMFKAVRHGKTTFGKMAAEFDVLHGREDKEAAK